MSSRIILAAMGAATVAAHGHVNNIVINGVSYAAYDVTRLPYMSSPPVVVGWANSATDNGFVAPDAYASPDIICHRDAENAAGRAQVAAGDSIFIQWDTWPDSHKGPIVDYLASCGDAGCASVDKTDLEFFKISEVGLVDASGNPGRYADSLLLENGDGWMVTIPENIAPGQYVLRHEIIALHSGNQANGAQNYPQCFNLEITGSGTEVPEGVRGTELYRADDDGILFNVYSQPESYPIPGPALIDGASPIVEQFSSAVDFEGTPTEGAGSGSGSPPAETSAPASTEAPATTSEPVAVPTSDVVPSSTTAVEDEPTATPTPPEPCAGRKHKRSKKTRRTARDVKPWKHVLPVRV
jgi:cellulase